MTALFTLELGVLPLVLGVLLLAIAWTAFLDRERERKRT
jgi:hypothetical protein